MDDFIRTEQLGRRPAIPLERRLVKEKAVAALASTIVITWQNQVFLVGLVYSTGGPGGYFWSTLVVFAVMYIVYLGLREKAERWPMAAGQYHWVAQMAPVRYARLLNFMSGWKLVAAWQIFLAAGVMIIGNVTSVLLVLYGFSPPSWLPTPVAISIIMLVYIVNRCFPKALARAEFPMLVMHIISFCLFTAVLLGLRKHSGRPLAKARDVFLQFRKVVAGSPRRERLS